MTNIKNKEYRIILFFLISILVSVLYLFAYNKNNMKLIELYLSNHCVSTVNKILPEKYKLNLNNIKYLDTIKDSAEYIKKIKTLFYIPGNVRSDMYHLMDKVNSIFETNNITYWIDGGTSIGALRHKGIIPWDDDIDICILDKDENKLQDLKEELDKDGYYLDSDNMGGYLISLKKNKFNKDVNTSYPFIDIQVMRKKGNRYVYKNWNVQKDFPNEYYIEDKLFPLKKYKFGELNLWGPKDIEWYIKHYYGNNVLTTAYVYPNHGYDFGVYYGLPPNSEPIKIKLENILMFRKD